MGLQGEVTLDVLIDSTGRVAAVKPLSGPVALQEAAMDALRQWKYEPARLNGQPVSMHLSVAMKCGLTRSAPRLISGSVFGLSQNVIERKGPNPANCCSTEDRPEAALVRTQFFHSEDRRLARRHGRTG